MTKAKEDKAVDDEIVVVRCRCRDVKIIVRFVVNNEKERKHSLR